MAREGGASIILYVALILSIILLIGSIGAVIVMNSEVDKLKNDVLQAKKKTALQKKKVQSKIDQLEEAQKVVNGNTGPVTYSQYQTTHLKDARTTLESILSGEWVTKEDIDLIKDQRIKETWEKLLEFKNEKKEYTNLDELYKDLLLQLMPLFT